ncbi:MAG: hypothetical protein JW751_16105 [Polyangiaceae bacterium]|nr:hypothetical protein [Polyangiaceae bacterium]
MPPSCRPGATRLLPPSTIVQYAFATMHQDWISSASLVAVVATWAGGLWGMFRHGRRFRTALTTPSQPGLGRARRDPAAAGLAFG